MIFQNIKTSLKRLINNKLYSIINIGGLSLSFAIAILILLYVHNELTTDKYHSNLDNLYRLTENKNKSADTPAKLGEYIKNKFPEIKYFTRYKEFNRVIQYDDNKSIKMDHIAYMDSSCLDMFTIHILKSNQGKLLGTNQSVIISETTAKKLFGDADPIGKTIRLENKHDYIIEGVFEDYPANSSFQHNIIASFPSVKFFWGWPEYNVLEEEGNWSVSTYVLLNDGVNKANLDERLQKDLLERFGRKTEFHLQEYSSIYFDNEISDNIRHGKTQIVYLFLSIAIIIIIIAMINYINLSTSISAKS